MIKDITSSFIVRIERVAPLKEVALFFAQAVLGIGVGLLIWSNVQAGAEAGSSSQAKAITTKQAASIIQKEAVEPVDTIIATTTTQTEPIPGTTTIPVPPIPASSSNSEGIQFTLPPSMPSTPFMPPTIGLMPSTADLISLWPPVPSHIPDQALDAAIKYNIPPKIFFALIWQESKWDSNARSHVGAIGLTQVMPATAKAMGYNVDTLKASAPVQLEAGARYLELQYQNFKRWDFALAAYNAGPGAVRKYGGIPPYRETRNYVRRILSMAR